MKLYCSMFKRFSCEQESLLVWKCFFATSRLSIPSSTYSRLYSQKKRNDHQAIIFLSRRRYIVLEHQKRKIYIYRVLKTFVFLLAIHSADEAVIYTLPLVQAWLHCPNDMSFYYYRAPRAVEKVENYGFRKVSPSELTGIIERVSRPTYNSQRNTETQVGFVLKHDGVLSCK